MRKKVVRAKNVKTEEIMFGDRKVTLNLFIETILKEGVYLSGHRMCRVSVDEVEDGEIILILSEVEIEQDLGDFEDAVIEHITSEVGAPEPDVSAKIRRVLRSS